MSSNNLYPASRSSHKKTDGNGREERLERRKRKGSIVHVSRGLEKIMSFFFFSKAGRGPKSVEEEGEAGEFVWTRHSADEDDVVLISKKKRKRHTCIREEA